MSPDRLLILSNTKFDLAVGDVTARLSSPIALIASEMLDGHVRDGSAPMRTIQCVFVDLSSCSLL